MRFALGLVLGMMCGAVGMYLVLEGSRRPEQAEAVADAGVEDAGPASAAGARSRARRRKPARAEGEPAPIVLTAADRKPVWRGDAVELPPRQLDMGTDDGGRALSAVEINQVIQAQSGGILECVRSARGEAPLDGRILVKMLVNGTGEVTRVRAQAPAYLFEHGFQACARKAARAMRYPATGAPTVVEAPYDLY